ncbi:TetR/AcrR family transcriptional regulator [Gordonia rhizosphera]|uniref:TetR/AcrR family transcriptional regulator n=1 Tax=Gordonia rhizosphera TaxID=83341 RepID=UPI001FE1227C|nr:TetR/AcrR family transcriptional regulator [Gordonia rhizosphera]
MEGSGVARRIASRAVANREAMYASEVGRLIDAGRAVMATTGTSGKPRVADIVSAAGLSNDAFYRHFRSKDELVAAILEDGTDRLHDYIAHQMGKEATPRDRVVRWVHGVLSQAEAESARTTRAVLWNAGGAGAGITSSPPAVGARLAELLHQPFAELGSAEPFLEAQLAAHSTLGILTDHLWRQVQPTSEDAERIVAALLRMVTGAAPKA